ncbi:large-conductance mechanosensitive channel protein MscL [Pontibacter sp. BT310]|uniref:Large-conductance mechanosensitive channel n=1 Tax=Pontibacter populi TaxID=890055 RepID=A0ABS6XEN7_9BACT|nr:MULTISPECIES: large-conductance mechanosensitive channel protein MscL [Pontibacter]MBJ6119562.1 large-conductance mechanosensitive channel protein MscL [Pontibacter sp. BT310]MBR0571989.1 large-conductance mechanosensitive channel protein MscL [Microvirga sp. STS03]MBW3366415.1 large-conductance mechanosensitive channel protein MscL [Pontibacter populi]
MGFLAEFKKFAVKGNVIDLAVGVVIGAAFGGITKSLVDDVIMPPLGLLISHVDFSALKLVLKDAVIENGKEIAPAVAINYGLFLQAVVNFLIIAFAIFLLVRTIIRLREKEAAAPAPPANKEEVLLTEIRDILKKQSDV